MYIRRKDFTENNLIALWELRSPRRCAIAGVITALFVLSFNPTLAQTPISSKEVGPKVGQEIPAFKASDQFGHQQTLSSLTGPNGLVLLFVRSADW
jgi:hypothetical protein